MPPRAHELDQALNTSFTGLRWCLLAPEQGSTKKNIEALARLDGT